MKRMVSEKEGGGPANKWPSPHYDKVFIIIMQFLADKYSIPAIIQHNPAIIGFGGKGWLFFIFMLLYKGKTYEDTEIFR